MPKVKVAIRLEVKIMILVPTPKFKVAVRSEVKIVSQQLLKNYWSKFNETCKKKSLTLVPSSNPPPLKKNIYFYRFGFFIKTIHLL